MENYNKTIAILYLSGLWPLALAFVITYFFKSSHSKTIWYALGAWAAYNTYRINQADRTARRMAGVA
jgi:hypothetical protein